MPADLYRLCRFCCLFCHFPFPFRGSCRTATLYIILLTHTIENETMTLVRRSAPKARKKREKPNDSLSQRKGNKLARDRRAGVLRFFRDRRRNVRRRARCRPEGSLPGLRRDSGSRDL